MYGLTRTIIYAPPLKPDDYFYRQGHTDARVYIIIPIYSSRNDFHRYQEYRASESQYARQNQQISMVILRIQPQ